MEFLDADRSSKLLSEKVFRHRGCPPELEELGKTIAKSCGGLPLAIVVIGGLLVKSDQTRELCRHIAENLNSIINSEDNEKCLNILSLGYNNLPIHLKPCFLCMAAFQEKFDVPVRMLIKAWFAEGYLEPIRGRSLEDSANEYIIDLRNLIFLHKRGILEKLLEHCSIHDLLRDLCLIEAKKKLIWCDRCTVPRYSFRDKIHLSPRLRFHQPSWKPKRSIPDALDLLGPATLCRSSISGLDGTLSYATNLQLLRLLDMADKILPNENLQLINLRYMSLQGHLYWGWILNSPHEPIFLPPEIWCLPQLRHVEFTRWVLLDPPACCHIDKHDFSYLGKSADSRHSSVFLGVLKWFVEDFQVMYNHHLSPGVEWPFFRLPNLVHLHKLESLTFQA